MLKRLKNRFAVIWRVANEVGRAIPEIGRALLDISQQLSRIEKRLDRLEYFSHGSRATYVGGDRVLVKSVVADANIAYLVEAYDRLISPWFIVTGRYENALTNYFVHNLRRDSHCLDVGTNFGYFLGLMGRFCPEGRVIGIEPDQHVYALARDNIFINGFNGHASVIQAAASDVTGKLTLYRRKTRSANTSIARLADDFITAMGEDASEEFTVDAVRLDDLLPRFDGRVDFLKIDVEGAEPLVFAGARRLIETNPDISIVMEWSPSQIEAAGLSVDAFLDDLNALNLTPCNIVEDGTTVPLTYEQLRQLHYSAGVVFSVSRSGDAG